jgi:hypothetical protein
MFNSHPDGPEPQPGLLKRTATTFYRALHIFRSKQQVEQKAPSKRTPVPYKGKLIDVSFSDFKEQLQWKKEALVAFYDNDDVCHGPYVSLTDRTRYGLK